MTKQNFSTSLTRIACQVVRTPTTTTGSFISLCLLVSLRGSSWESLILVDGLEEEVVMMMVLNNNIISATTLLIRWYLLILNNKLSCCNNISELLLLLLLYEIIDCTQTQIRSCARLNRLMNSKKDIKKMSSKSKDDPLTSSKTMPLLSHYYQSMVSVQFTSGWRDYWGVMDQNKIYLCDTPCLDFSTSARVVLELTEQTRVQGYGNEISRRNKFCFILAPTHSLSREKFEAI